jgi:hypothetical protein
MSMTIKQWLETIPDDLVRTKALHNLWNDRANDQAYSLAHALFTGFLWYRAPEKYDYWKKVHESLKKI